MLLIFALSPETGRGRPCIATGVDKEMSKDGGVAERFGETRDVGRVIKVMALPINAHDEVVADDGLGQPPLGGTVAQAREHRLGGGRTALGMSMDALRLTQVVEEQRRIKQRGVRSGLKHPAVPRRLGLRGLEDLVELEQAAQRMDVGRPTVIELELDQAMQTGELRQETHQ